MKDSSLQPPYTRLGIHYYPDTLHYRESDLAIWLPKLHELRASWVVLEAPLYTAIPETFLREILDSGIHPIIHFNLPLNGRLAFEDANLLFQTYARWGVRFVVLFNLPNARISWNSSEWVQTDLVERFLDRFLPLADLAQQSGLIPIFPPLEPGGDYWDTAFLQDSLKAMIRRNHQKLLNTMALGAYAYATDQKRPLDWGAGGPERWPGARPYSTPSNQQDQCGFMIYDWYLAISKAILGKPLPVMLFGVGKQTYNVNYDSLDTQKRLLSISQLCLKNPIDTSSNIIETPVGKLPTLPPQVVSCNLWGLANCINNTENFINSFINSKTEGTPGVVFKTLNNNHRQSEAISNPVPKSNGLDNFSIQHYLLLPVYEWGVSEWHLEAARPFIVKHHPTIGFSLEEAKKAAHVTVVGGEQAFPEEQIEILRRTGCKVKRIDGDGTRIASQLEAL